MTEELFMSWLHHFKRSVSRGVSPTNTCLLIFNEHGSHVALPTIQEARMLGIDLLTLPAHGSHKLQALDVSVFSPFKTYFKSKRVAWIARFPNIEIRRAELAELSSKSLAKALIVSNIVARFKGTGIWPLNPDALTQDMQPSTTTHINDGKDASEVQNMPSLSGVHVSP
ncbi:MFS-type transporter clz9-like [Cryptomeria japonica]|uniref:MFS-type transporter clz9-like n=1 Tax=Cryptomeria japonica TaxID=3369 RepID=UPI0027DAAE1C|nr:MFS-type transporter clz9-like [Cryptomeria japonica]